jgi:hypothetical protein
LQCWSVGELALDYLSLVGHLVEMIYYPLVIDLALEMMNSLDLDHENH